MSIENKEIFHGDSSEVASLSQEKEELLVRWGEQQKISLTEQRIDELLNKDPESQRAKSLRQGLDKTYENEYREAIKGKKEGKKEKEQMKIVAALLADSADRLESDIKERYHLDNEAVQNEYKFTFASHDDMAAWMISGDYREDSEEGIVKKQGGKPIEDGQKTLELTSLKNELNEIFDYSAQGKTTEFISKIKRSAKGTLADSFNGQDGYTLSEIIAEIKKLSEKMYNSVEKSKTE